YLADRSRRVAEGDRRTTLTAIGLAAVPIGLVFLQPDFGTALVYGAALAGVLFVAGTGWAHLATIGAVTVLGALLVLWILPAVGAGGVRGRGVAGATQTALDYLPEHATDFVFASLAEQRGFVGATILLLLYLLVVWRGLRIVTVARDGFCSIVAGGIVVAFLF